MTVRAGIYLIAWNFDLRIEILSEQGDKDGIAPDGWPTGSRTSAKLWWTGVPNCTCRSSK
ncbi:MAG: hypothetical protein KKB02_15275 [Alphaproteobacteria bacterium]|nr:hypothetical protein [Alphaproteobacteria bacterium]